MLVYYLNGFGYSFLSQKAFWCRLRSLISLFPLGGLDFSAEFSGLLRSSRESIRANVSLFFITVARKEHFFGVDRGYLLFHNPHMKNFFPFSFFGRSIIAFGHSQNMSNRKGRKNFVYSSYRTQSGFQMQEIGLGESERRDIIRGTQARLAPFQWKSRQFFDRDQGQVSSESMSAFPFFFVSPPSIGPSSSCIVYTHSMFHILRRAFWHQ